MSSNIATSCFATDESNVQDLATIFPIQSEGSMCNPQGILSEPQLLTDRSRLQEIYDLRVNVWEHLGKNEFVNRRLYPNGWFDELDEAASHWIILNDTNEIVASARMNVFYSFDDFPYYSSVKHLAVSDSFPFAFFSRLVIHPMSQGNKLSRKLAKSRMQFCELNEINTYQVFINNMQIKKLFEKLDFKNIGLANVTYHPSSHPHSVNVYIRIKWKVKILIYFFRIRCKHRMHK